MACSQSPFREESDSNETTLVSLSFTGESDSGTSKDSQVSRSASVSTSSSSDSNSSSDVSSSVEAGEKHCEEGRTFQTSSKEEELNPDTSPLALPYSFFFEKDNLEELNYNIKDLTADTFHSLSTVSRHRAYKAVLHRQDVDVAHRRQRLLSQRCLGDRVQQQDYFLFRRVALKEDGDDASLLITFSNAAIFYDLLHFLSSAAEKWDNENCKYTTKPKDLESKDRVQSGDAVDDGDDAQAQKSQASFSSITMDELLSRVNPYFCYHFGGRENLHSSTEISNAEMPSSHPPSLQEEESHESRWIHQALGREKTRANSFFCRASPTSLRCQRSTCDGVFRGGLNADQLIDNDRSENLKGAKKSGGFHSSSKSVMKASLNAWEMHLEEELKKEGETIESYRQKMSVRESEIEKQHFLEQASWNEYALEAGLQERQKKAQERRKRFREGF